MAKTTEGTDREPSTPEKGAAKEPKPDTGTKQDLQHPETAEKKLPVTASHDMDPPGQGDPEHAE